jgi:DNA-binding MarR family transcriptional regulator
MRARARGVADQVWQTMVSLVMDNRDDWRRKAAEAAGVPFSRVRALLRLDAGPLTLRELAEALLTDAPAATVTVNDLEARGLVERRPHPSDRRAKLVSLTGAGRRVIATVRAVTDQPPSTLANLPPGELASLRSILSSLRP